MPRQRFIYSHDPAQKVATRQKDLCNISQESPNDPAGINGAAHDQRRSDNDSEMLNTVDEKNIPAFPA